MIEYVEEAQGVFSLPLLESDICREIVESAKESKEWQVAEVGSQSESGEILSLTDAEFRSASVLFTESAAFDCGEFETRVEQVIRPFIRQIWELDIADREQTQIVRYGTGGHYEAHSDAALDLEQRYFTVVCYLNEDFDGGQTSFPYLSNLVVCPKLGRMIIFPSRYVHRAEPVSNGEKYVAVTWLHGPVAVKWL
jgi:Rps23 Pro-64 3,4-dihydroxylase Tpa1-like proline 4-hydroxylase